MRVCGGTGTTGVRVAGPAELAKAALESVCFQTRDLLRAMRNDWPGASETFLRVDGGITRAI